MSDLFKILLASLMVLVSFVVSVDIKCSEMLSVDISDGVVDGPNIIKFGITFTPEYYYTDNSSIHGCVCNIMNCVRKCCNNGEYLRKNKCISKTTSSVYGFNYYNLTELDTRQSDDNFYIFSNSCEVNMLTLRIEGDFFLQSNGSLYGQDLDTQYVMFSPSNYCLDYTSEDNSSLTAFICIPDELEDSFNIYSHTVGMIISMPFLLVTFVVYLILPERNLHRKALMSYVSTLLVAYICLVTIQLYPGQFPDASCHTLGYLIIFFFLVSFFWMNVMCVDMWLAFSGMRTFLSKKTAERKRFIIYCIYAWGMPIIHVIIVLLLNTYSDKYASYNPEIGARRCFLGEGMPTFYYFYLPMAILIGINISLFILTTVRIQRIKKETSMLKHTDSKRHSYEDDKQKFNLYLKLMFAMGVNWTMELVSWVVDYTVKDTPTFVWYLTDCTNAMYGVLIFLIFVFKKKIWRSLKKRYYVWIGKPHLAHSMTTSSARGTRTSNYSTTDTAVSNDYRLSETRNGKNIEETALNRT